MGNVFQIYDGRTTETCPVPRRTADAAAKSLQSGPTLCNSIDGSPPGSSIHGIFQVRVLEWGAIAFSTQKNQHHIEFTLENPGLVNFQSGRFLQSIFFFSLLLKGKLQNIPFSGKCPIELWGQTNSRQIIRTRCTATNLMCGHQTSSRVECKNPDHECKQFLPLCYVCFWYVCERERERESMCVYILYNCTKTSI